MLPSQQLIIPDSMPGSVLDIPLHSHCHSCAAKPHPSFRLGLKLTSSGKPSFPESPQDYSPPYYSTDHTVLFLADPGGLRASWGQYQNHQGLALGLVSFRLWIYCNSYKFDRVIWYATPTSGHLHLLFPVSGAFFSQISASLSQLLQVFAKRSPSPPNFPWSSCFKW